MSLNLRSLGSEPEKIFTFDDLQNELRRCGNYALIICPLNIRLMLTKSDDIPDLDEFCDEENDFGEVRTNNEVDKAYKDRISDVIADLIELGYHRYVGSC